MLKGIKFRLYPNDEQIHKLAQIFGCVRYVYNKAVEAYLYAKEQHLKYPTYEELKRMLYRLKKQEENKFLLDVNPLILTITLKNFIRLLGMYQKGVNEEPHFKKKFSYQSFTLINNNTIKLDDFYVFIPKVGNIKYVKTMM